MSSSEAWQTRIEEQAESSARKLAAANYMLKLTAAALPPFKSELSQQSVLQTAYYLSCNLINAELVTYQPPPAAAYGGEDDRPPTPSEYLTETRREVRAAARLLDLLAPQEMTLRDTPPSDYVGADSDVREWAALTPVSWYEWISSHAQLAINTAWQATTSSEG